MLSLLPCKRAAGLASVLEPHKWLETEWHGIELNIRRRSGGEGWEVVVKVGSVWNGVARNGKRDFSMSKIMGEPLRSTCPLASSSFVTLVAPQDGSDFTAEPLQIGAFIEADAQGQLRYDTASFLSTAPDLDVSLQWLSEEKFNYIAERLVLPAPSSLSSPSLGVRRSFISSSALSGTLQLHLTNPRPDTSRRLIYRDVLPWFLDFSLPTSHSVTTLQPQDPNSPYIRFESDEKRDAVRRVSYTPSAPRRGPAVLELELVVPPASEVTWSVEFDKETLRYEEHPPDAHRGLDVGAATGTARPPRPLPGRVWKTQVGLIEVAVPDFSMPYNVIIFTSTIIALFAGSAVNILTRRFTDVEVPPDLVSAAAAVVGVASKRLKGKEKAM
ncbi:hypothetical protein BDZ90DRAFT_252950 [Jaminaea rosea]|uniref:Gpi16 subunit, GPI transamidase component n=1 Tax=Jaminaea rosea TaxID=1569628 RepID=A0A316UQE7_9BASI|nr:hypothetical protein BDZ90DRAFT_252950 [Jaminaea rosea]PWN27018.1 hypothetical protein BDZ90DRAFT_252950 [Jaminaea rosea]